MQREHRYGRADAEVHRAGVEQDSGGRLGDAVLKERSGSKRSSCSSTTRGTRTTSSGGSVHSRLRHLEDFLVEEREGRKQVQEQLANLQHMMDTKFRD